MEKKGNDAEMLESKEDMATYEVGYMVIPDLDADALAGAVSRVRARVENCGGAIFSEEFPTPRTLAYPLVVRREGEKKGYTRGYFGWMRFDAQGGEGARTLAGEIAGELGVIRSLVVRSSHILPTPPQRFVPRTRAPERVHSPAPVHRDAPALSEAELDKTIDELVIE